LLFLYLISEIPEFLTLQVSKNVIPFYFPIEAKTGLPALKNKKEKIFSNLNYFVYATIKIFYKIKYILRISLILADAVPYYHHYIVRSLANVVPCFLELSNKVKCFKSFVRVSQGIPLPSVWHGKTTVQKPGKLLCRLLLRLISIKI